MLEHKQLFDFLLHRVREVGEINGLRLPQAFGRWFAEMYFQKPQDIFISDGSGDAKVDLFFHTNNGREISHSVVNSKFTENYNAIAPVEFYNEAISFWQAFKNKGNRSNYLNTIVRPELRTRYKKLFDYYDKGTAKLYFITNCRKNSTQVQALKNADVEFFHMDDILQFMADYIEDAMPNTPELLLTGINNVLSTSKQDSEVPTSIVFARLSDFIEYMSDDPYDLLFARNVRLDLGKTPVNTEIRDTFENSPTEFAFSHNGVTLLAEKVLHDPGRHEIRISNPRVVNGSQTLHSIRHTERPSGAARVMVRIIEIPRGTNDLPAQIQRKKEIVYKISIRSNRQNNIKKWDLVSNDDFHHELARFFRSKKLYYERRRREWSARRTELKSLGIRRGPEIKGITQLLGCYFWSEKYLGPAAAKREIGALFDGKPYEKIKSVSPETCYQVYLLDLLLEREVKILSKSKKYIATLSRHMRLCVFSLVVKAVEKVGTKWGRSDLTSVLEAELELPDKRWYDLVKLAVEHIHESYRRTNDKVKAAEGRTIALPNYFKSQTYIGSILTSGLPKKIEVAARIAIAKTNGDD